MSAKRTANSNRRDPAAGASPEAAAILAVRVIPRSPRTRVDGMRGDAVLIRLAAPPVDGAANDALIAFLSDRLELPRRSIRIVSGETSRNKRVALADMDLATALKVLGLRS